MVVEMELKVEVAGVGMKVLAVMLRPIEVVTAALEVVEVEELHTMDMAITVVVIVVDTVVIVHEVR